MLPVAVEGNHEIGPRHQEVLQRLAAGAPAPQAAPTVEVPAARADEAPRASEQGRTLRVAVEKLDRLMTLAGEIAISRGRLRLMLEELGATDASRRTRTPPSCTPSSRSS